MRVWFSYFPSTVFLGAGLVFVGFISLPNVMSCITLTIFVYTQYLSPYSNWLWALISPIVRTVSKSPDLLARFDLFRILSVTQVKARLLAATW